MIKEFYVRFTFLLINLNKFYRLSNLDIAPPFSFYKKSETCVLCCDYLKGGFWLNYQNKLHQKPRSTRQIYWVNFRTIVYVHLHVSRVFRRSRLFIVPIDVCIQQMWYKIITRVYFLYFDSRLKIFWSGMINLINDICHELNCV